MTAESNQVRSEERAPYTVVNPTTEGTEMADVESTWQKADWRIKLGISITGIWLLMLALYISSAVGWLHVSNVPIDTLGSFLEGAFAPLAFLWFVLAYFSQQKELSQNTQAIKQQSIEMQRSVEQAAIQANAISASEVHARRESFIRIADIVKEQLGHTMGFLFLSSQGVNGTGQVPPEKLSRLWHDMGQRDPQVFSRQMLELSFLHGDKYAYKLMWGTPVRTRHSESFIFHFERLLASAGECDTDGMIRDAIEGSTHGHIYHRMIQFRDNPPEGITHGVYDFDPDSLHD